MQNYPNKTIFDYYHPWRVGGSIEKEIATLPKSNQPIFNDALNGNFEQLREYLESLEFIVDTSAAVNFVDGKGRSPIHLASAYGHFEVVELLLSYGI